MRPRRLRDATSPTPRCAHAKSAYEGTEPLGLLVLCRPAPSRSTRPHRVRRSRAFPDRCVGRVHRRTAPAFRGAVARAEAMASPAPIHGDGVGKRMCDPVQVRSGLTAARLYVLE